MSYSACEQFNATEMLETRLMFGSLDHLREDHK